MYVNWSIKTSNAPQLSYTIAVYDNQAHTGKPIATQEGTDPDARNVAIHVPNLPSEKKTYYLTLQLTDIFNQQSEIREIILEELKP
ncbi:hypothetical protein QTN47_03625 [Danxiaibacter flavus]|uniref:Uncharacterized protein n=1 Tax=Danxiaibacter flavus TaxID=3049108 RepID=A0ABV3Z9M4_9BACT|nr:hypothetical protein QNM32_03625 [Chitinophagaceae bacterium DXS]